MADTIGHQAIAASAGSGKTFQLAHRYIRLMANGVRPDQISALTFSRKAAGEIFDSIVRYLCDAAGSADQARSTAERIGKPDLGQEGFLDLLRTLLVSLHRLHVGTLDSFTVGVIGAFPMELGISTGLQLMENDGAESRTARQEVLARIFDGRSVDAADQRRFLEAFKQATFGQEEKGLDRSLDTFIGLYHGHYQVLPLADAWGQPGVIWPDGSPWLESPEDVGRAAERLRVLVDQDGLSDSVARRWHDFIDAAGAFCAGSPWVPEIDYLFGKLVEDVEGLRCGSAAVRIGNREYDLPAERCGPALALLTHLMRTELGIALEKTRGLYRVLDSYEQVYDEAVRRRGRLTFTDAQYLLTAANTHSGGSLLSRDSSLEARLYIDYRLDCRLDHWLLDEFQDTSDLQWEVLRNLADEILQDGSGQRSFFYVGDVKQAIYGWRGGNSRLFGQILEQYGECIEQVPLSTSFRSCQPVIDTVNRVFGDLGGAGLPDGAVEDWERVWQTHRCQEEVVPSHGYVAVLEPPCEGGELKPAKEDRYRVVAGLLNEIDPLSRGLSVAVLVRTNECGKDMVDFLRGECPGMNIVHEGRAAIKDNPVVSALLSLVKFAAHPGDTTAWRHLQMSPLKACFEAERLDRDSLSPTLLREIQACGFEALVRRWGGLLDRVHPLDDFGRKRLDDLFLAAGGFDANGAGDCNAFLRFVDNYEVNEIAADDAVRVMTIHQSKGLGFDMVILPDLQKGSLAKGGQADFVLARHPETGLPAWALKMPRRVVAENDAVLEGHVRAADETASFDALCALYVALTRARQGLYMVTCFPGKTSAAITPAAFLKSRLVGDPRPVEGKLVSLGGEETTFLYEEGESDWYLKTPQRQAAVQVTAPASLPEDFSSQPSGRLRLVRVSPSARHEGEQKASLLFEPTSRDRMDLGTAVHGLFEMVSWINKTDVEKVIRDWLQSQPAAEGVAQRAAQQFRQALASEEVWQALSCPQAGVELWRERHFEIVLDRQWVSGAFDRVHIVRGTDGKPVTATVLDFKSDELQTDNLSAAAGRYRSQMELYGEALARMLHLDPSQVSLRLVFTHPGKVYDLR